MTLQKSLVVSIHDVAPPVVSQVREILGQLRAAGIGSTSLLVIPNFQGKWPIDQHPDFCKWLHERRQAGDEIVLHGYEHVEVKAPKSVVEKIQNRVCTVGEGEFLSLSYAEARERLEWGLATFRKADLHTTGFVAPSWLMSAGTLDAIRDLGIQYTNTYVQFTDLRSGRTAIAPSLVFGPGNLNEDWALRAQRVMGGFLRRFSVVRVVIHPPCIENSRRFSQILGLIRTQLESRVASTYGEFLEVWRGNVNSEPQLTSHEIV